MKFLLFFAGIFWRTRIFPWQASTDSQKYQHFYVALLAPDTSGGGEKPSLFSEKSRLLMDHKKSSEEIRRLRTKVRTLRTKVRRLRTKINRLRTNKNSLRTNKNRLSGAGSAGVFRIVRLKTGLNPSLTRSVEGNECVYFRKQLERIRNNYAQELEKK